MTTTTRTTRRRRLTTAFAVVAGLAACPAGAASAAPTEAAPSPALASEASSWQYKDWYYFEADCHDYGEFYVDSPYFDYDDYKCEYAGTWPGDYYNLYLR